MSYTVPPGLDVVEEEVSREMKTEPEVAGFGDQIVHSEINTAGLLKEEDNREICETSREKVAFKSTPGGESVRVKTEIPDSSEGSPPRSPFVHDGTPLRDEGILSGTPYSEPDVEDCRSPGTPVRDEVD